MIERMNFGFRVLNLVCREQKIEFVEEMKCQK